LKKNINNNNNKINIKIQFLSILNLIILNDEDISLQITINKKINILNELIKNFLINEKEIIFISLQLLLSISISCYDLIIKFENKNLIKILTKLTFSNEFIFKYYSILIWSNLIKEYKNFKYLCQFNQLLSIFLNFIQNENNIFLSNFFIENIFHYIFNRKKIYLIEIELLFNQFNLIYEFIDIFKNSLLILNKNFNNKLKDENFENNVKKNLINNLLFIIYYL
jgi:hypothetical protein